MDELHTVLVGAAIADGDIPSFYVGSVSRYEGGSWLIAFPVGLLLALGAWAAAAVSWAAAAISITTVALGSVWLARHVRPTAGLFLGPVLAFAAPEVVHYSYRAWGSLHEALVMLPVIGLAGAAWLDRGRPRSGAVGLGVLLGIGLVLSYVHFITALAVVGVAAFEARSDRRRMAVDVGLVAAASVVVLGVWIVAMVPIPAEALEVRGGRSLASTLPSLLLVRLDLVLTSLPLAWVGAAQDLTTAKLAAGAGLVGLTAAAAIAVWRAGGRGRHLVIAAAVCVPALSVGHSLVEAPMVLRYYLPLLGLSAALIVAWDDRAAAAAVALGLLFWIPSGLVIPGQDPVRSHAELGGNALHRYAPQPHAKFLLLRAQASPAVRPPLAFGYGRDTGLRFSSSWSGIQSGAPASGEVDPTADPHLYLFEARAWISAYDGLSDVPDRAAFFQGLGVGLVLDHTFDDAERVLLDAAAPGDRASIIEGMGAAARVRPVPGDVMALEAELPEAWARGYEAAASPRGLGRLMSLPLVATPE
ncbi:MAG: hypothetical protein GY898_24665 [Proteobacteria bacterium]|nr:hypothetical protein [Pseudomonadota bacterium]